MRNVKVTVAIPIYNAEEYLDYAIVSVLNQTFTDFELLLLNDGSTDDSLKIIKKYQYDSRVHIINDGENKGLIYRLNQSIDKAKGKYYARMDADDIMFPDRLEKQYLFLEENPEIDVLGASSISIDANNTIIGFRASTNNWNTSSIAKGTRFTHPTVMGHLEWFKSNKYNSGWHRAEDYELWLRTHRISKFYNLEDPVLFYREIGIPTVSKYCASQKTFRKLLVSYKSLGVSFSIAMQVYLASYLKSSIYTVFTFLGVTDYLVRKRSKPIKDESHFKTILNKAISYYEIN